MEVSTLDACVHFDDELIHYMLSKKVHIVSSLCSHCWNIVISNHTTTVLKGVGKRP